MTTVYLCVLQEVDGFFPGKVSVIISGQAELMRYDGQALQIVVFSRAGHSALRRDGGAHFRRMQLQRAATGRSHRIAIVVGSRVNRLPSMMVMMTQQPGQHFLVTSTERDFNLEPERMLSIDGRWLESGRRRPA